MTLFQPVLAAGTPQRARFANCIYPLSPSNDATQQNTDNSAFGPGYTGRPCGAGPGRRHRFPARTSTLCWGAATDHHLPSGHQSTLETPPAMDWRWLGDITSARAASPAKPTCWFHKQCASIACGSVPMSGAAMPCVRRRLFRPQACGAGWEGKMWRPQKHTETRHLIEIGVAYCFYGLTPSRRRSPDARPDSI
jgi:hypothetical protein